MSLDQRSVANLLLSRMPEADFVALAPAFELVELTLRQVLTVERQPVSHVYFPESGLCSVLAVGGDRELIEAGLFGRDGMSYVPLNQEAHGSPTRVIVQAAGTAWRLPVSEFSAVGRKSPALLLLLLSYQQTMTAQTAYTCLAHGSFRIEERLARWLLMCQDRIGDVIPLVHEFLAYMLAVRRAGVTDALQKLEARHLIRTRRGRITILDRPGLIDAADGSYGAPEDYYESLLGAFGRPPGGSIAG
jgi:CRP-like cAMP-binding protein